MKAKISSFLILVAALLISCSGSTDKKTVESRDTLAADAQPEPAEVEPTEDEYQPTETVLETHPYKNGVASLIKIETPNPEYTDTRTILRTFSKAEMVIDELEVNSSSDGGGVSMILLIPFGEIQFENDTLFSIERGVLFSGPVLNGQHYFDFDLTVNGDGTYTSAKGETLTFVNQELEGSHLEYYKINKDGLFSRVWDNWKALGTVPKSKLSYTRNVVFARHDYKFKRADLRAYFSTVLPNYQPTFDNVDDKLTAEEKKYVAFIKKLEDSNQ